MIDGKKAAHASIIGAVAFVGVSIGSCYAKPPDNKELENPEPMPLAAVVTGANGTATVTASGGTTLVVEPVEFHPNTMGDDLIQTVQVKPGGSVLWKRPA